MFEEDDAMIRMYAKKLGLKAKHKNKIPAALEQDGLGCRCSIIGCHRLFLPFNYSYSFQLVLLEGINVGAGIEEGGEGEGEDDDEELATGDDDDDAMSLDGLDDEADGGENNVDEEEDDDKSLVMDSDYDRYYEDDLDQEQDGEVRDNQSETHASTTTTTSSSGDAAVISASGAAGDKYIPPHLRKFNESDEKIQTKLRLRKQIQGSLNRYAQEKFCFVFPH